MVMAKRGIDPRRPIESPRVEVMRYTALPLPPYRHVPVLTPHPIRDAAGHSHAPDVPHRAKKMTLYPDQWRRCETYLYAIDLYNNGYFWEAHETWEGLWLDTQEDSAARHLLQAMIQCAAAHLKRHTGREAGVDRLLSRLTSRLIAAQTCIGLYQTIMGVEVRRFSEDVTRYFRRETDAFPAIELRD